MTHTIDQLRDLIRHYNHQYYVLQAPLITDYEYDQLFALLVDMERADPSLITPDSPTQRVGGTPSDSFSKVSHTKFMGSLDTILTHDDVLTNAARMAKGLGCPVESLRFTAEPKYDGISIELVYENGQFHHAATRGDGQTGEDVTHTVRTIRSLPLTLRGTDVPSRLAVRGEIYMRLEPFHAMNERLIEQGQSPFVNPRNATSGTIRQLDPRVAASRPLVMTCYELMFTDGPTPTSHADELDLLTAWGFPTPTHKLRTGSLQEALLFHAQLADTRDRLPFEIDGVVMKLNAVEEQVALGDKSRSPRWALAYKFPPRQGRTIIHTITIQVGRTGVLTPVAELNPVDVGGVTITRATLHNAEDLARKDVRPGDLVCVERAGDVIPAVTSRIDVPGAIRSEPFQMPEACPICASAVVKDGVAYYCTGHTTCPAQLKAAIEHCASKQALNIDGLGEKTVAQLVERGLVRSISDLFALTIEQVLRLEGFGPKSAKQLIQTIAAARVTTLPRVLFALGIHGVGEVTAKQIAMAVQTMDRFLALTTEQLMMIEQVGEDTAREVMQFLRNPNTTQMLPSLLFHLQIQETSETSTHKPLQEKIYVITGTLEHYGRTEAKHILESLGATVTSSVSKKTTALIAGTEPGSKLADAERLGIPILSSHDFRVLIGRDVAS